MKESKMVISKILHGIVPGVIALALVIGICAVGLMILNGRTKQSESDPTSQPTEEPTQPPTNHPTEPPTEQPTEPPTEEPADPMQDLKNKARKYMEKYVYNSDKYELIDFTYNEIRGAYVADFRYMVNGVKTREHCLVNLYKDGIRYSVSKSFTGQFANVEITNEILNNAEDRMYRDYLLSRETSKILSKELFWSYTDLMIEFAVATDGSPDVQMLSVTLQSPGNDRQLPDKDSIPIPDGPLSEQTAVYYLSYYVGDTSSYLLKEFSLSPDGLTTAIFHHQLGGLYTGDMCTVIMREDKSLYNCFVHGEGMYDDVHFTEEDMEITTENLYVIYGLSKDEWLCTPVMIEWYFGRLTIGFEVKKIDGSDIRYFNVPINYKKHITDPEAAVFWAAEYFGEQEFNYEVSNCTLVEGTDFPHYDVSFILGKTVNGRIVVYEYTCEVGVPDGQIRNISIKPI